jgi:hypothetical protein
MLRHECSTYYAMSSRQKGKGNCCYIGVYDGYAGERR